MEEYGEPSMGGDSWVPLTDHLALNSFCDLEINPFNPNDIYALTGDGDPDPGTNSYHTQSKVASIGIMRSTDGGNSWTQTGFVPPSSFIPYKLLIHPLTPNVQYIASDKGIHKTTNGWQTGNLIFSQPIFDIEFKPGNPSVIYGSSNQIIRSVDSGNSWDIITDPDFDIIPFNARIELAVTPNHPNYVAAMAGNWNDGSIGTYYSSSGGGSNQWIMADTVTNIIGAFANYCIGLAIDPNDYNKFYGGGVRLFKSTNEGYTGTWSQVAAPYHADIHDIQIKNGVIYVASDGGLIKSSDGGSTWTDLSKSLNITEIYQISGYEPDPELYYIGAQDNGIQRRTATDSFKLGYIADGFETIVDYDNPSVVYAMTQLGGLHKSTDGGENFTTMAVPNGLGAWQTPLIMDASNRIALFMGKDTILRSLLGGISGSWLPIGTPEPSNPRNLNVLAQAKNGRNRIYASQGFRFYRSDNALAHPESAVSWTTLGQGLPDHFITDIAVNPSDSNHVIVTLGNYDNGTKVYESLDGGDNNTWVNISGSLPNVPVLSIEYHDDGSGLDRMYIGTDIGVFYRDDNIGDWIYFSNFLPVVPVTDLYINPTEGTIAAGTYGRGLWRSNLISSCEDNITILHSGYSKGEIHHSYNSWISSQATISTDPGTNIFYRAGNYIDLKDGFLAPRLSKFKAEIGPCPY